MKTKENEAIEEKLNNDKIKLLGEVDKEKDFDEKEFEKMWAIEVVGMVAAKKSFKSAKDCESLETQNKVKQKEKWKKGYSNTKQEDLDI